MRKHVLSVLQTLVPSGSTLQLAISVPVSVMSLVYTVHDILLSIRKLLTHTTRTDSSRLQFPTT
jgi:hypothetical protein